MAKDIASGWLRLPGWSWVIRVIDLLRQMAPKTGDEPRYMRRTWWAGAAALVVLLGLLSFTTVCFGLGLYAWMAK